MSPCQLLPLFFLSLLPTVHAIFCFDGVDCKGIRDCEVCEGSLCLRITKPHSKGGSTTAVTCIPDSHLSYYPEGCRSSPALGEVMCVCSMDDLCNTSSCLLHSFIVLLVCLLIGSLHV